MKPFVPGDRRRRSRRRAPGPARRSAGSLSGAPPMAAGQGQEQRRRRRRRRCRGRPRRGARRAAVVGWTPLTASALTAPAMKRLTNGVAMPSLRPLSTLRRRRTPEGTRSSSMMVAPERGVGRGDDGADGGGHPEPACRRRAARPAAAPAPMVSGRPMPRRRAGSAASARRARTLTREASAKSTRARVTSASERMVDECRLTWIERGRPVRDGHARAGRRRSGPRRPSAPGGPRRGPR